MKLGVTLSTSLHTALIAWSLLHLSAPAPLVTLQDEGVEVDFAALEPAKTAKGEKRAEADPVPAPEQTKRPEKIRDAKNIGDANADEKSRKGELTYKPLDTVKAQAAPEAERQINAPEAKTDPALDAQKQEAPVASTEVANLNQSKISIDDPPLIDQSQQSASVDENNLKLPDKPPVPVGAPRPKPKQAETKERKKVDEQKVAQTAASTEKVEKLNDQIADLLNKQKDTESGAKRETKVASIGNETGQAAPKLTKGEYDALKGRVSQCWSIPAYVDQENLQISLLMRMGRDGTMAKIVSMDVTGVARPEHVQAIESGLARNLDARNCSFADVLPAEKYETWREVRVNFEPGDF